MAGQKKRKTNTKAVNHIVEGGDSTILSILLIVACVLLALACGFEHVRYKDCNDKSESHVCPKYHAEQIRDTVYIPAEQKTKDTKRELLNLKSEIDAWRSESKQLRQQLEAEKMWSESYKTELEHCKDELLNTQNKNTQYAE